MPHSASTRRSAAIAVWSACAPCHQPNRAPAVIQACCTSQCLTIAFVGFLWERTKRRSRSARTGNGSSPARSRCAFRGSRNAGGRSENGALPVAGRAAAAAGLGAVVVVAAGFGAVVVAAGFGAVVVAAGFGAVVVAAGFAAVV